LTIATTTTFDLKQLIAMDNHLNTLVE